MLHQFFTRRLIIFLGVSLLLAGCKLNFLSNEELPPLPEQVNVESSEPSTEKVAEHVQPIPKVVTPEKVVGMSKAEQATQADTLTTQAQYLAASNEYSEALRLFDQAIALSPTPERQRKMAHVAFRAKEFQRSADLYKKNISALSTNEKKEFLQALRYTGDDEFLTAISNMALPEYLKAAFHLSWTCENEFISCEKEIKAFKYDYEIVRELKKTLTNYETLKNKDASYKTALLVGVWYKYGDYTVAIKVGDSILKTRPDYRPVLKIVGLSSYMIGKYDEALGVLAKLKQLEPKDPEVDFLLGLINFEKGDMPTANIYLENALKGGYKDKALLQRKLAYSYASLGMSDLEYKILSDLIKSKDSNEGDITNALYIALSENQLTKASEWIGAGLARFPKSVDIQAMQAWYLRLSGKTTTAKKNLETILQGNPNHLTALVQMGILETNASNKEHAKILLTKAKAIDAGGTWTEEIDKYLAKLN